jgi:hypothetical protein
VKITRVPATLYVPPAVALAVVEYELLKSSVIVPSADGAYMPAPESQHWYRPAGVAGSVLAGGGPSDATGGAAGGAAAGEGPSWV